MSLWNTRLAEPQTSNTWQHTHERLMSEPREPRKYGYTRVSTREQRLGRQVEALKEYSIPNIRIIREKQSGKDFERPKYQRLKQILKPGDELYIKELDRLGRNKDQIKAELQWFKEHHITIRIPSIPTTMMEFDASNEWVRDMVNNILIEVMGAIAQQERETMLRRQREGIEVKRAKGGYSGVNHTGKKRRYRDPALFEELFQQFEHSEINLGEAAAQLDIATGTLSTYFKARRETGPQYDVNKKCGVW